MMDIVVVVVLSTIASTLITRVLSARGSEQTPTKADMLECERTILRLQTHVTKLHVDLHERLAALPTAQEFNRVRSLAEGAAMICENMVPDSGIAARSFDGAPVITGMKG
jgi:hypothetical protein